MKKKGLIVAFYGMNNIGKTTVVNGVAQYFEESMVLKYPIYNSDTGQRINDYLRNGNPENLSPLDVQKIFAQNRTDHEGNLVRLKNEGKIVLLEDYKGTGIAWGVISENATVEQMEEINQEQLEPDLSILLDGERFIEGAETGHKHEGLDSEAWNRGRRIHRELAERYSWRTILVKKGEVDREINEAVNLINEIQQRRIGNG